MTDVNALLMALLSGAVAGAWWGFVGWRMLGKGQEFDGPKFLRAVLWGAVIGGFAAAVGLPIDTADALAHQQLADLGLLSGLSGSLDLFTAWLWKNHIAPLMRKGEEVKPSA